MKSHKAQATDSAQERDLFLFRSIMGRRRCEGLRLVPKWDVVKEAFDRLARAGKSTCIPRGPAMPAKAPVFLSACDAKQTCRRVQDGEFLLYSS